MLNWKLLRKFHQFQIFKISANNYTSKVAILHSSHVKTFPETSYAIEHLKI